jgi:hypothetical protein
MSESIGINIVEGSEQCCEFPLTSNLMHLFTGDEQDYSCMSCYETKESKADDNAWNMHEEDRLGEGHCLSVDTSDAPSASEWVASITYIAPPKRRAIMIERWDEDNPFRLIELAVKFIDTDEPVTRSEFLPPIAQLMDGGVYEEYWELNDMRQRARETECQWCHLLTPKQFNDCQACDKPLELNVR